MTHRAAPVFVDRHLPAEELHFRLGGFGQHDLAFALSEGGAEMASPTIDLCGGWLRLHPGRPAAVERGRRPGRAAAGAGAAPAGAATVLGAGGGVVRHRVRRGRGQHHLECTDGPGVRGEVIGAHCVGSALRVGCSEIEVVAVSPDGLASDPVVLEVEIGSRART